MCVCEVNRKNNTMQPVNEQIFVLVLAMINFTGVAAFMSPVLFLRPSTSAIFTRRIGNCTRGIDF